MILTIERGRARSYPVEDSLGRGHGPVVRQTTERSEIFRRFI